MNQALIVTDRSLSVRLRGWSLNVGMGEEVEWPCFSAFLL